MFYKSTTDKKSFFNKESRYVVTRRFKNHRGSECHREQEVDSGKKVEGWFLRKKFFALKNNVQWSKTYTAVLKLTRQRVFSS